MFRIALCTLLLLASTGEASGQASSNQRNDAANSVDGYVNQLAAERAKEQALDQAPVSRRVAAFTALQLLAPPEEGLTEISCTQSAARIASSTLTEAQRANITQVLISWARTHYKFAGEGRCADLAFAVRNVMKAHWNAESDSLSQTATTELLSLISRSRKMVEPFSLVALFGSAVGGPLSAALCPPSSKLSLNGVCATAGSDPTIALQSDATRIRLPVGTESFHLLSCDPYRPLFSYPTIGPGLTERGEKCSFVAGKLVNGRVASLSYKTYGLKNLLFAFGSLIGSEPTTSTTQDHMKWTWSLPAEQTLEVLCSKQDGSCWMNLNANAK